jgi:ketosteroid isomerase-like protein
MTPDEIQIRRLVEEKAAALRDRDPKAMVAGYAPGATVFSLAPPLRQPGDARDPGRTEQWLSTFHGPMDSEFRDVTVDVDGAVAFCTAMTRLTATPKGMTESFTLWYRSTLGLRRIDGRWRIVHEHESVPFEMDGSFQASLGLQP